MAHYDLIVLGTGGVGSAALFHAARRGLKVLGLDRFPPGHNRGSSHGETRMIRLSYFEHPDYVPLLRRSYTLWDELDPALLQRTGVLYVGPGNGPTLSGVRLSAERYGLQLEPADPATLSHAIPDGADALFEPDAGLLPVEECVIAHVGRAVDEGAEHRFGEEILEWRETGAGIEVETESETFSADRLIIAAGAWASEVMADLDLPLQVLRKHLHWYQTDARYDCGFFYELEHGQFYGFPSLDGKLKLGEQNTVVVK
jgi:sarcosine oxidase